MKHSELKAGVGIEVRCQHKKTKDIQFIDVLKNSHVDLIGWVCQDCFHIEIKPIINYKAIE